jgi:nicotinamide riboside transporter PnuC
LSSEDPALKYIPKLKGETKPSSSRQSSESQHGVFTTVAYATAWSVVIIGTIIGILIFIQAFQVQSFRGAGRPDFGLLLVGIATVVGSWISAAGVGTLAEISRKLTKQ